MPTSVGMTLGVAPVGQTFRYLVSLVLVASRQASSQHE
jgi:hypothetical protein